MDEKVNVTTTTELEEKRSEMTRRSEEWVNHFEREIEKLQFIEIYPVWVYQKHILRRLNVLAWHIVNAVDDLMGLLTVGMLFHQ